MTPLDAGHAAMEASGDEADRRAFWGLVAASELHLWLAAEPEGDAVTPRVFGIDGADYALAFDVEERLADFAEGVAPHATLPGRRLAAMLSASGLGLGLNFGAPSQTLLPPDLVAWLAEMATAAPSAGAGRALQLGPPALDARMVATLDQRLAATAHLFRRAWLAAATWEDGRAGHLLAIEETVPGTAEAIAAFLAEALAFAGGGAEVDVTALEPDSTLAQRLARVALRFDPPQPDFPKPRDPDRPPRLR